MSSELYHFSKSKPEGTFWTVVQGQMGSLAAVTRKRSDFQKSERAESVFQLSNSQCTNELLEPNPYITGNCYLFFFLNTTEV